MKMAIANTNAEHHPLFFITPVQRSEAVAEEISPKIGGRRESMRGFVDEGKRRRNVLSIEANRKPTKCRTVVEIHGGFDGLPGTLNFYIP